MFTKRRRGKMVKTQRTILLIVTVLLLVIAFVLGKSLVVPEFKTPVDFFNQVKSYNDNSYFCPEKVTLAEVQGKLNQIDPIIKGNLNPESILTKCQNGKFFSLSAKSLSQDLQLCVQNLKKLFEEQKVPEKAYTKQILIAECVIQEYFKKSNKEINVSEEIDLRTTETINQAKIDYYSCANIPVGDEEMFSCAKHLAITENNILEEKTYDK